MYFALVVHPRSSLPRGVCGGWLVLLRHTSIHCLCMLARVGIHTIHTILISFRLGCPWVFPHTTIAPRRWRPLVLHLVVGGLSTFWRWRLPLLLLAYRAREEGGFYDICSVGGCAGVAALCASFF